ncbi:hypothetical protein C8J56DRAFT_966263 [Mycena floridula]|nr:hypothetical protein C8J56DRAFT_966263 [Mycena floridula]
MLQALSVTGHFFSPPLLLPTFQRQSILRASASSLQGLGSLQEVFHGKRPILFHACLATSSSTLSLTILSCLNAQLEFHRRTLGPVILLTIIAGLEESFLRTMLETRRTLQIPTDFVQSAALSGPVGPQDIGCRFACAFEGAEAATVSMT